MNRSFNTVLALTLCGVIGLAGCRPKAEVRSFDVVRQGWDTLQVSLVFQGGGRPGAPALQPDSLRFVVFDTAYDTVSVGLDSLLAIPDARLGNEEALLLEGCGWFNGAASCEQYRLLSSPKRVVTNFQPEYPAEDDYEFAKLALRPSLERKALQGETWQRLDDRFLPPLELVAKVQETEDQGIRIPVAYGRSRVDLSSSESYRDFRFHLRSAFRDAGKAVVQFKLVARIGGEMLTVAQYDAELLFKSESEQLEDLGRLVESFGRRALDALAPESDRRRSYVFVNDWSYEVANGRYDAEIEIHWRESRRRRWFELTLGFSAKSDAREATMKFLGANDRARERWRDQIGRDSLRVSTPLRSGG